MQIAEIILVAGSFLAAYYVRNYLMSFSYGEILPINEYIWIIFIIIPIWAGLLKFYGVFGTFRLDSFIADAGRILISHFWGVMTLGFTVFLFQKKYFSRSLIIIFAIISFISILLAKIIVYFTLSRIKSLGFSVRNIIIVGTGEDAIETAELIEKHKKWGLNILGFATTEKNNTGQVKDWKILCAIVDLPEIVHNTVVHEIIICLSKGRMIDIEKLLSFCEEEGIRSRIVLGFYPMVIAKPSFEYFHGKPLLTFNTTPEKNFELFLKRAIDLFFSVVGLVLLSPLICVVSLAVKTTSNGPVFFRQTRVGLAGRRFVMYKFRSMYIDAEDRLRELISLNERDGPAFKLSSDPRVTPLGKIIRATNLDELPQLFNVLRGDMSLVGPRPPLPSEVIHYERWQRRRLSMKPGMTCFWQISGEKNMPFQEWMKLDLKYIDNWSLITDIKIILKTIPKIFYGLIFKNMP